MWPDSDVHILLKGVELLSIGVVHSKPVLETDSDVTVVPNGAMYGSAKVLSAFKDPSASESTLFLCQELRTLFTIDNSSIPLTTTNLHVWVGTTKIDREGVPLRYPRAIKRLFPVDSWGLGAKSREWMLHDYIAYLQNTYTDAGR